LYLEGESGLAVNPEFLAMVKATFAADTKLIVGCRSGNRSLEAARLLLQDGFNQLVELRAGFMGARDAFGRKLSGWLDEGFPSETGRDHRG
jgi:rhodanese-related sulfurtransferase